MARSTRRRRTTRRRPVSVRAVAASMRLPYETARRNIRRLEAQGVCTVSPAGVVVPEVFMRSQSYVEAAAAAHERLVALYLALRTRGLLEPLPASHYDEGAPPVRAAVRHLSDFLLRTADAVVARCGDLVSTLVLLPLMAEAAGLAPTGLSVATLSRRVQVPDETVRRHAAALTEAGICVAQRGRLAFADAEFASATWNRFLQENAIAVQRMFAGLAERGVVAAWDRQVALAADRSEGAA
jgi:DNA-binding IclR family transcriptional regulator